jgi:hypothetical protein
LVIHTDASKGLEVVVDNVFPRLEHTLVEKRLSLVHQNGLSLANVGSPATYMPAVMLTAGEFCSSSGIIFLPLAHLACAPGITCYPWRICNRCAGDKISENLKKIQNISKL